MCANQAYAAALCCLDTSKAIMQEFWDRVIRPRFQNKVSLCFSDTDSYVFLARAKSADDIMEQLRDHLDTSNYPKNHPLYSTERKNMFGYFKNECPDRDILTAISVRPKAYVLKTSSSRMLSASSSATASATASTLTSTTSTIKRAKGVPEAAKQRVSFEDYYNCVRGANTVTCSFEHIRNVKSKMYTVISERVAMTSFSDKRYTLCDIHSCPYGSAIAEYYERTKACYFCKYPNVWC